MLAKGSWTWPEAGSFIGLPDGRGASWVKIKANPDGWFEARELAGGYAAFRVSSKSERVAILEASGHSMVYVNGVPRAGDPYGYGYVKLPVLLKKGENELLFAGGRGRLRATLAPVSTPIELLSDDPTLPDVVRGSNRELHAAALVRNATTQWAEGLTVAASCGGREKRTKLGALVPLSVRKVGFAFVPGGSRGSEAPLKVRLLRRQGGREVELSRAEYRLRVRGASESQKRTFVSEIDGSVQYYALNPAVGGSKPNQALFLSLHGASVEAIGQAEAYGNKLWGNVVCPTNRRPYGFDWEDWGRLDAMEVLGIAERELKPDPARVYLTGHSMGGHGTWQIGVHFPDRFAAIGPSAGWISFVSYGGGTSFASDEPIGRMLRRASLASDTLALATNYAALGVYALHGDADDNVPVTEARTMTRRLSEFHKDFVLFEQPGAGHWWDAGEEPGADCVDWGPMFDFFARHARPSPDQVRHLDFCTASPGVSARFRWATIVQQTTPFELSRVVLDADPLARRVRGTTVNVDRLAIDVSCLAPGEDLRVELDGSKLEKVAWPADSRLHLVRSGSGSWRVAGPPQSSEKRPDRGGPFKDAFRHRFLFVVGTQGTDEEDAWTLAKARFDAESFWYRGNGSVDVVPDASFDARSDVDRSVVLYGNQETNSAWKALVGDAPVEVSRGRLRLGGRSWVGEDLGCLAVRPRPGSGVACVALVAPSGPAGQRALERMPYFVPGASFPDCLVVGADMLESGTKGVRAAGYFGNDWRVETGDFAFGQ